MKDLKARKVAMVNKVQRAILEPRALKETKVIKVLKVRLDLPALKEM